jgi:hypothetical protein
LNFVCSGSFPEGKSVSLKKSEGKYSKSFILQEGKEEDGEEEEEEEEEESKEDKELMRRGYIDHADSPPAIAFNILLVRACPQTM